MKKLLPKSPFFETGVKNYIYGDAVLEYAQTLDRAAIKYEIDALFISPYTDIRRVAENTEKIIIIAPHMDVLRPGRGIADILPEALIEAGAKGVLLNHCEKPLTLAAVKETIDRANELEMITFACADSIAEAKAIAQFEPDIICPEPTDLIGTASTCDMEYALAALRAVKDQFPQILVDQSAGITTGSQVYDFIMAGYDACGAGSGILNAPDPLARLEEMVYSVRKAKDDLAEDIV